MKPGAKLKSTACDTEVMVIKACEGSLECGGQPMADEKPDTPAALDQNFSAGTLIGKRYVNADQSLEVLCVRAGAGSLALNGAALEIKDAKPLPSSD
jgi:hypothetical protein